MIASYENGYFLDSNVWIYAMAHNQDINKHNIACRLVNTEKAAVEEQMAGAKIIYLATHGLLDELSEPGIPGAVALAPSGKDHGLLSANEVLNLHFVASLQSPSLTSLALQV